MAIAPQLPSCGVGGDHMKLLQQTKLVVGHFPNKRSEWRRVAVKHWRT
jgi:hypothetical protein